MYAIQFLNAFFCDHLIWSTFDRHMTALQTDDLVRKINGLVDVMQNHNDRDVEFFIQFFDQFQDLQLIADIQISGRLIQEQKFGILCQCHGDPDSLSLSA